MKAAERRQPHPPRFAAVTYMIGRRLRLPPQIPSAPPQITTRMDTAVLENDVLLHESIYAAQAGLFKLATCWRGAAL